MEAGYGQNFKLTILSGVVFLTNRTPLGYQLYRLWALSTLIYQNIIRAMAQYLRIVAWFVTFVLPRLKFTSNSYEIFM